MDAASEWAARFLDILLPTGGSVAIFESYFDASGPEGTGNYLSIAGYRFEKDKANQLQREWSGLLSPFISHLPPARQYFNMGDFIARRDPWDDPLRCNDAERLKLQRRLIESARAAVEAGVVATIRVDEYEMERAKMNDPILGSAYAMLGLWCAEQLTQGVDETDKIIYLFEKGDAAESELDARLKAIGSHAHSAKRFRYQNHNFPTKTAHCALGASDMLAWEFRTGVYDYYADPSHPTRCFLDILLDAKVGMRHFDPLAIKMHYVSELLDRANLWAYDRRQGGS